MGQVARGLGDLMYASGSSSVQWGPVLCFEQRSNEISLVFYSSLVPIPSRLIVLTPIGNSRPNRRH